MKQCNNIPFSAHLCNVRRVGFLSAQTKKLITLAKNGDADAFGELYELYYKEMYCYACCVTGSEALAQDAVQDAALSAFRQIGSIKNESSFKGWLFTILRACCNKQYTKNEAAKSLIYIDDENSSVNELASDSNLELSTEVRRALEAVSAEEKEIVLLSTLGNYRSHEIAGILGINASTVRSKLKRALKKMREYLNDDN